jgi:hypothetical protein
VVAERNRIGTHREQLIGEARCDPDPVRSVLAVDDAGVDPELGAHRLQTCIQGPSAWGAYDVGDEEDAQGAEVR